MKKLTRIDLKKVVGGKAPGCGCGNPKGHW
jgi:hypothetical protein